MAEAKGKAKQARKRGAKVTAQPAPSIRVGGLLFARRVNSGSTTTLEGIYDQISAGSFPARVDQMNVWIRLFYSAAEIGAHQLELTIWDVASGERVGSSGSILTLPARPDRQHPSNDITFDLANAQLPHPGEYEFRLSIDAEHAASGWLTVTSSS